MRALIRCGLLLTAPLYSVPNAHAQDDRAARWQQDLEFFSNGLRASGHAVDFKRGISTRGQIDFAKLYPKFDTQMESLRADLPQTSDGEVVLALMRLVASANVAHNSVNTPNGFGFSSRLPLAFQWFADGPAVTGAAPEYASAIGTRVVRIGEWTPDEVLAQVAPYIAHENQAWLRIWAMEFLRPRAVLQHFHLLGADGRVTFTLQKPGGETFTLAVATADARTERRTIDAPIPLFRSQPGKYYWHRYLEDSGTLYIQYNVCENDPKLPFAAFASQVLADADARHPRRVVIDLRFNGGGNSRVIGPLKSGLAARRKAAGGMYVLIGPGTFSSAELNAEELKRSLKATLVGEATGGKPGGYGEVKELKLPNSKLVVRYTTKNFGMQRGPSMLEPDIAAPRTLADVIEGRDRALEAAIAGK